MTAPPLASTREEATTCALDMDTLSAAFAAHTAGSDKFTRRMAVILADMDGTTPRQLVLRCERLGLLRCGSWEWFRENGGINADHVREARNQAPSPESEYGEGRT